MQKGLFGMEQQAATIDLITREEEHSIRGKEAKLVASKVDVGILRDHFRQFLANLQSMIALDASATGPFQLNEIQFSAEITANGEFKLLGTGVGIEANSAITFVLQRNRSGDAEAAPSG